MKIKRVKLCNFSSYAGENEINLETSERKNVILIGGNNGAGKTSLFTAIKLALYGPQCFRFQDKNNQYTARIRELINHDAFLSPKMHSYVELEIDLPTGQNVTDYIIRREWCLKEKRLVEHYAVIREGAELEKKDLDFFQNYLFTIVPPNMFDFFFFDGEEVGEFFSSGRHGQYLKEAVLTLSGFDTFNLIQKFCRSFVGNEQEAEEFAHLVQQVEATNRRISELEDDIQKRTLWSEKLQDSLSKYEAEHADLETKFLRAGGMNAEEREKMETELAKLERIKSDKSKQIRGFVESLMPVYITRNLAMQAEQQLRDERLVRQYDEIRELLSTKAMMQIIQNITGNVPPRKGHFAAKLSAGIANYIKPNIDIDTFSRIHDLSDEQEKQVVATVTNLRNFSTEDIIEACAERAEASMQYDRIAGKLRNALPEIDAQEYYTKLANVSISIQTVSAEIQNNAAVIEREKQELEEKTTLFERQRKTLQQQSRYQTAYGYTEKIRAIMEKMIDSVTQEKVKSIEALTLQAFDRIIRKDNFIQLVELDSDFNVSIYKKQTYTVEELCTLAHNIGVDALEKRLGGVGIDIALKALKLSSRQDFRLYLSKNFSENQISLTDDLELELYNRVDLNQLSRGEKQVFVLSLYWAIIKSSNQKVPFIIDTPFARIDTEHRAQISKIFFPEISDQVVVLSTDEEVVGPYHQELKPFIACEYLLDYDVSSSRTNVMRGYFDEV